MRKRNRKNLHLHDIAPISLLESHFVQFGNYHVPVAHIAIPSQPSFDCTDKLVLWNQIYTTDRVLSDDGPCEMADPVGKKKQRDVNYNQTVMGKGLCVVANTLKTNPSAYFFR